ncbi:hypothetical protein [Hymenobacter arizonensis]|uniref:Uncharacterized protein n=1 Tax=Hymenobacter arizonensis TaxID=1227077 RepID=A0A1I5YZ30_HYMAR|nr:hypothetical protein [Hymenobacter arizonensis]SFQ49315.1 hypothetical protein SAMN04515668_2545 [Hymenobacter arizonensis]
MGKSQHVHVLVREVGGQGRRIPLRRVDTQSLRAHRGYASTRAVQADGSL